MSQNFQNQQQIEKTGKDGQNKATPLALERSFEVLNIKYLSSSLRVVEIWD